MDPLFIFDDEITTSPRNLYVTEDKYYRLMNSFKPNIATGVPELGIFGHGGLLVDYAISGQPFKAKLTKNITDDDTNMYYLIEPWPAFDGLKEIYSDDIVMPLGWHNVIQHIPQNIINLANKKRLTILLHIPEYTTSIHAINYRLQTARNQAGILESQFKFISGIKTDKFYYWPAFEYSQFICYNSSPVVNEIKTVKRDKKYTCLNRIDKAHRRYIAIMLKREQLHTAGYYSYTFCKFTHNGIDRSSMNEDIPYYENGEPWGISPEEFRDFYNDGPYYADQLPIENHNDHWHVISEHYDNAYWNFVTETSITDNPFITEKIFKPIANLQPFVLFGSYKTLELLHDLGYKTFGDYIDESYDNILEHADRIKAATEVALKLAHMSDSDHIKLMIKLKPILEHNKQHFFRSKGRINNFVKYINKGDPTYNWLKDCKYD